MIKRGVKVSGLQPEILLAIQEAREVYRNLIDLTITALLDGTHMENSLHYKGLAVDLRTHYFSKPTQGLLLQRLKEALGPEYDVVLEKTHIHVEFDPK